MLGHWVVQSAPVDADAVALTHLRDVPRVHSVRADLRDPAVVAAAVESVDPAIILHAAYAKDRASIVDATQNVVDAARKVGASVILTSTDAVFEGDGLQRSERATPDAAWDYGRWKAEAERAVLAASGAVVRLPLLVSIDPDDPAVSEIRAAAATGTATRWFSDEMRRPAFASEVAAAIWRIAALPTSERNGCWHLAGPERLSRYDIARRTVDHLGLPPTAIAPEPRPPTTDRPRDIAFTDARARTEIGWNPSPIG